MADNLCGCKNPLLFANRVYGDLCSIERLLQDSDKELISTLEADLKVTKLKVMVGNLLNELETMGFSDEDIPKLNTSPLGSDVIKETFWQKDDEIDLTSKSRILSDGKLLPKTPKPQVIREKFGSVEVMGEEKPIRKISILRRLLGKEG